MSVKTISESAPAKRQCIAPTLSESHPTTSSERPISLTETLPFPEVIDSICSYPLPKKGIYIGFSFLMDLNVLARRPVEKAYLCSNNLRETTLYLWIQQMIVNTPSRQDFLIALEDELASKETYYLEVGYSVREAIDLLTAPQYSWLHTDEAYAAVRSLYQKGGIIHSPLNLKDQETIENLAQAAHANGQVFDVISLHRAETLTESEYKTLTQLFTPDTILATPSPYGLDVTQPKAPIPQTRSELFHALNRRSFRYNPSDFHGHPFLLTTEDGHPGIFRQIDRMPQSSEGGLYLGFAFEFNYHILARRNIKKAYICDIAPSMTALYTWVQTAVTNTLSRETFMAQFQEELFVNKDIYFPDLDLAGDNELSAYLKDVFNHYATFEFSWLKDDASYRCVRDLYRNGKIVHMRLNLAQDTDRIRTLATEGTFDVVYISNITEWVRFKDHDHYGQMVEHLESLVSENTILVDSKRAKPFIGRAVSRLTVGNLPDFTFDRLDEIPLLDKYRRSQARRAGRYRGRVGRQLHLLRN